MPSSLSAADELLQPLQRIEEGGDLRDLGADVAVDTDDLHVRQRPGPPVLIERLLDVDPELVRLEPRRDVGVCLGVHVGVDTKGNPGLLAHQAGPLVDDPQLLGGLHVEHQDVGLEGEIDLVDALPHAGVNDLSRVRTDLESPVELAAGNDVDTAPLFHEDPHDGQVRVRLGRIADDVRDITEGPVEDPEMLQQGPVAVQVEGRADFPGNRLDGNILAPEPVVTVIEVVHPGNLLHPFFI